MIVWKLDALMRQRRAKGRQMATRMGIGENYLSRVRHEVPDRLSLALLDALCRELDCTIADLLEYRPSAEPPQVAIAELHQEVTPARRRPRRAPPAPVPPKVQPTPVAEPVPQPAPEPAPAPEPVAVPVPVAAPEPAPEPVPAPVPVAAPEPPRVRPVLPLMAPLPGSPAPKAAPAPAPAAEEAEDDSSASDVAAHYVRMDALQARLDRLKRRR